MATNFGLTTSTPPVNVIQSINYLLASVGTVNASSNVNLGNVVQVSSNNAIFSNVGIIGYVNGYMGVKYANSATGSSGFTSNSTMANYYGIYNSPTNTESSNPADYQWTQVVGGFGTTKGLWYTTSGGNTISFQVSPTAPNQYYQPVPDNVPIVLATISKNLVTSNSIQAQAVTNVQIATATITNVQIAANTITANNIQANTITAQQISANTITANNIQTGTITGELIAANTIQGNSIVAGSITANELAANLLVVGNIVSIGATLDDNNSAGYWLDNASGNVRFGGNVSVGQNLYVSGLINSGNLTSNVVTTNNIVLQSISLGLGASSSNQYTVATPKTDNNTSSGILYTYPYALANVSNIAPVDTIYINATYNSFFYTANTATITIYSYLIRNGVKIVQVTNQYFATGGNIANQYFYVNPSFTYVDYGLLTTTANYSVAWGVYGPTANVSSTVTSMTYYGGTVVAQTLKR